ncbi:MAG: Universal stress protein [Methanoregula sp. PtaU1.Bin051]|nr:MAG: Universal stress protein [Methanoregula sp. PtaU1.Bin051]
MFEKVLFPTDFSERADIMLDCVAGMPGVREVILLHVIKETLHPMGADVVDTFARQAAGPVLEQAKHYLRSLNPEINVTLTTAVASDIAEGILATAEKTGAGLIVITARAKGVKAGVLLGSVPSTLLCRNNRTNILFMRHRIVENLSGITYQKFCPSLFHRILCPTDFSAFSDHATALAGSVKGIGEVIILHVAPGGTGSGDAEMVQAAQAKVSEACRGLAAQGIRCRAIVTAGNPAEEIVRAAEEQDVSVICISSFGKGCLHDFVLGSTVQDVATNSTRPVLVVRSKQ